MNKGDSWGDNGWSSKNESNDNYSNDFRGHGCGRGRGRGKGGDRNNNSWGNHQSNASGQNNFDDAIQVPNNAFEELFIKGNNYETNEDDLKDTLNKYGSISTIKFLKIKRLKKEREDLWNLQTKNQMSFQWMMLIIWSVYEEM